MRDLRNICLIDMSMSMQAAFEQCGCTVLSLKASPNHFFHLPAALAEHGFVPDLVVQRESLGERSIVTGLDTLDCPTLFWAVDPHLNHQWQSAYARLFDLTCSTQRAWIPRLKEQGASDVRWLPVHGFGRPWRTMADRQHDVAFVGRVTNQRPARKWLVEFLRSRCAGYSLAIEDNLTFQDMLALYLDSGIIPNESIFGEVNFRLFEATSCGCLVLSQDLGDEQEALFELGREFDTYSDIVELDEKLAMYLKNDRLVQTMGRAARERVQREHLPIHRAQRLLEYAQDTTRNRACGSDCTKWTTMAVCTMWEAGLLPVAAKDVVARLASLEQDAGVLAATLRVQAMVKGTALLTKNIKAILGGRLCVDSLDLNLAGSMAALRVDHWDGAKAFWYRQIEASGKANQTPPENPVHLLTLWAKELQRQGRIFRGGFTFDPEIHLPWSAMECLLMNLVGQTGHLPSLHLLETMLRPFIGFEQTRVGFLSILTLHERNDWRLAFEIAFANLKSFRHSSGLEELQLAYDVARKQGKEKDFHRALAARDTSGRLAHLIG